MSLHKVPGEGLKTMRMMLKRSTFKGALKGTTIQERDIAREIRHALSDGSYCSLS